MLSEDFLLERGYCCGHGCLMCPYIPKHKKDNTVVMKKVIDCYQNENPIINKLTYIYLTPQIMLVAFALADTLLKRDNCKHTTETGHVNLVTFNYRCVHDKFT